MKRIAAPLLTAAISSTLAISAQAETYPGVPALETLGNAAPALEDYTENLVLGEVWKRPDLSPRDRSVATLAALVARNQTGELRFHVNFALDNGVKPAEISEIITHLAFYAGWGNATSAANVVASVFEERGIGEDQLPAADIELLPLDVETEEARETAVQKNYGGIADGVLKYTTEALFRDLWLRPDLAPRDRSLVTVSALIATGKIEQVSFHLGKAMDNGLTKPEASELLTHLAFYAGWPNIFSTLPVAEKVFEAKAAN
ncbi:carboxymuconolactone decarboxylase family protein [Marinobacterium mangrovicola]|uniref:4-carboxymuconolactone decarboxylase n=1 Tax=Marinobacterium mangrovicola TaxID=1476959 RepID=A0A4R1G9A2_9GAMM|nr:carboxymuconolactone decarboxylase family protein [Marinobacterium mangrovicola]TCK04238.1 4-carboxymuconolactone decarboxylase [Marinobacterium mangrovicola]